MRSGALAAALAATAALAGPAGAQGEAGNGAADKDVPTVTVINKAPDATAKPAAPELPLSPQRPASPSPAAAAAETAPAAPAAGPAAPKQETGTGGAPAAKSAAAPGEAQDEGKAAEPAPLPAPTLAIDIDLTRQVMTVREEGARLYTWRISTARYGYRTPTGTYRPTWMAKMWYSRQYDMAPMPHAIFFHKGVAIHATYDTAALGRPASHGCVRLLPRNAAALYKLVTRHGKERTEIVVHGKPDHAIPRVASDTQRMRERPERFRRGAPAYRYLPPSYYGRGGYAAYGPPPGYDGYPPRTRRYYAAPRRPPRGLYSGYSSGYGYGF